MNVVLLVLDALRSDHLGASGYYRAASPNMDKLAKNGVFFRNAITPIPRTSPAVASILTGLYPHSHGIRFLYTTKLNSNASTMQAILQAHGYSTVAHAIELQDTGLEKGFDIFNPISWRIINKIKRSMKKTLMWEHKADPVEMLTNFGIKQINSLKDKKFFLYLHYMGLHWPYDPPQPYAEMFDKDYKGKHNFNKADNRLKRGDLIFNNKLPKEENEHAVAHYDGAIRYVDFQIGRLIEHLNKNNLVEDTLIILTSDHGEGFGEHNIYFEHGEYLYDETLIVPLIIRHPKLPHKIIKNQVQLTDIMPTVMELMGITLLDEAEGASLLPLIKENKEVRKYTFAETERSYYKQNRGIYLGGVQGKWRMIRTDEWKLIYIPHPNEDIYELYNIKKDPRETTNLIKKNPEIAKILKEKLFEWIKDKKEKKEEQADLTEKSKKLLRKLGYMD